MALIDQRFIAKYVNVIIGWVVIAYHFILGSTVFLWEVFFIYHFIIYDYGEKKNLQFFL